MGGLPLIDLPLHLQEKIIRKLKLKYYCRLQQTCKQLEELIRTDRHIIVHSDNRLWFQQEKLLYNGRNGIKTDLTAHSFYGISFKDFFLEPDGQEVFDRFCKKMEEYRIRCTKLCVFCVGTVYHLSKEQCETVFGILKPRNVFMNSSGSNRYEAVFNLKKIRDVELSFDMKPEDLLLVIPKFFARCRKVALDLKKQSSTQEQLYPFIKSILQILNSFPSPQLKEFSLAFSCEYSTLPSEKNNRLLDEFRDYNPVFSYMGSSVVHMTCLLAQRGTCCNVKLMNTAVFIFYRDE